MRPVPAVDRGTTASRLTLIAWCAHISKISTPSPLQKISSHACHVAKLRGGTFKQRLGNDWIVGCHLRVICHSAHFFQCADAETIGCQLNPAHWEPIDAYHLRGCHYLELHQIYQ